MVIHLADFGQISGYSLLIFFRLTSSEKPRNAPYQISPLAQVSSRYVDWFWALAGNDNFAR